MKKNYIVKVLTTLLICSLAGVMSVQAATTMNNYSISKSAYDNLPVVCATTFSIADEDSPTQLTTFPLSDVVLYPSSGSLKMDGAYTEKRSGFGTGGSDASPYYVVTNDASNVTTSFSYSAQGRNFLMFHSPAKHKTALSIRGDHRAYSKVYFDVNVTLVSGNKTQLELWAGPTGKLVKIQEFVFEKGKSEVWYISDYQDVNKDVHGGSDIVYELRRGDYNEGGCVFALSEFRLYSVPNILKISGNPLMAPIGTSVKFAASYETSVTQQMLRWYQGKSRRSWAMEEIPQFKGQNPIEVMPPIGSYFYTVSAYTQTTDEVLVASTDTLEVIRYLECGDASKVVWHEDFGTLASESERSEYDGMQYDYAATGNVDDGKYAVTANPRTCGQDNSTIQTEADYWFRNTYDHTQGGAKDGVYGGMLLINCRDAQSSSSPTNEKYDVVLERKIFARELGCMNTKTWINFSAWFANADWARGRGVQHDIKMELWICDKYGNKNQSITVTAGINEGWKRGLISTAYDGGDIVLKIVNYGQAGGGNDVLIDDIQLEICRPVVGIKAETLSGKEYEDAKNVRTQKCGDEVVLTADPADSFMDVFPNPQSCPYYMWLQSVDGKDWEKVMIDGEVWQGVGKCEGSTSPDHSKLTVASIEDKPMYYKALIGMSLDVLEEYFDEPTELICEPIAETPNAFVYCSRLKLTLEKERCNEYEAEVENAEAGHTFKWEYGNDNCGWTVIEGQTGAEIKFNAKTYFDILNNGKQPSATSADDGCCEVGIKVTDTVNGDFAFGFVPNVFIPSLVAELQSQEDCLSIYKLTANITDACWNEPLEAEIYEFYKDGQKIDRCNGDNGDPAGYDEFTNIAPNIPTRPTRGATAEPTSDGTNVPGNDNNGTYTFVVIDDFQQECDYEPVYVTEPLLGGATYTVKFDGSDDVMFCEASVTLTAGCEVMWPTIITPYTKDGKNDVFTPFYCADKSNDGKCNKSVEFPKENIVSIKVLDRSGNMVCETAKEGWDGTSGKNGTNLVMPAVYFYVAVCNIDGTEQTFRGTVEVYNELQQEKK